MASISVSKICIPFSGTIIEVPDAPSGLLLTIIDDASIQLNWTDNSSSEDGFRIYYSDDGVNFTELDTVSAGITTYTANALTDNFYWFYVVAYNGGGESTATSTETNDTPLIVYAANTIMWYDYTDASTLTDDGGGLISLWEDKLASGHDLVAAAAARPTLAATGIIFNGSSNYMKTAQIPTFLNPCFVYMVVRQLSWTAADYLFDGFFSTAALVWQRTSTPDIRIYSGSESGAAGGLTVGSFGIVRALFYLANSFIQVNNNATVAAVLIGCNMQGLTLGSNGAGASNGNIEVKEIIIRDTADNAPSQTAIYNYLATKYGLPTI